MKDNINQIKDKKGSAGFYAFGKQPSAKLDFSEIINKEDYVSFGEKNDAPQELLRLYETASPLHTALINKTAQMIAGAGFVQELIVESISDKLFFENRFSDDSLDDVVEKVSFDLAIFNGFYLNAIFDESGEHIAQIEHIPFETVRAEKSLGKIEGYYVSRNWLDIKKEENKPVPFDAFDEDKAKLEGQAKSQILAIKVYSAGMSYYPKPAYIACIPSLKANASLNNYNSKAIENGFNAGTIIINKGIYTPEEQKALHNDIKKKYTGSDEANDFIMMFAPTEESVPEILPIATNMTEGRFLNLKESIIEDIIEGHRASNAVAGREIGGQLASKQELKEQHDVFNLTVVRPLQKKIEDAFNWLAEINKIESKFKLNDYDFLAITQENEVDDKAAILNALNSLSPLVANKVLESMSSDEIRGLIGLAPSTEIEQTNEQTQTPV